MNNLLINLGMVIRKFSDINLNDALSKGQIESKMWLINELAKITSDPGLIFLLGGWYGILATMMFESKEFENLKIRSFDIDPRCADIADTMNRNPWVIDGWQFKASTADIYKLNYKETIYTTQRSDGIEVELIDKADIVINTSCEHLDDFDKWFNLIPDNMLVVLQSNNYHEGKDHTNCVDSLEVFKKQAPLTEILYEGKLDLDFYKRFMLIGKK